jgi:hypothetical protein
MLLGMLWVVAVAALAHVVCAQSAFNSWQNSSTLIYKPISRAAHTARIVATDCSPELMMVFGGLRQGPLASQVSFLNSTWFLNLDTLQWYPLGDELDALGPSSRAGHSMVLMGGRKDRIFLFGGRGADRVLNDTWVFTLDQDSNANCTSKDVLGSWQQLDVACSGLDCPPPRHGHVAVSLAISNSIYVVSGCSGLETSTDYTNFSWLTMVAMQVYRLAETPGGGFAWSLVTVEAPNGYPPARFVSVFAAISEDSILIISGSVPCICFSLCDATVRAQLLSPKALGCWIYIYMYIQ